MVEIETIYEYNEWVFAPNLSKKRIFQEWLIQLSVELKKKKITEHEFLEATSSGVQFKNYCGFISHFDQGLEILPKVFDPRRGFQENEITARKSLLTLMSYSGQWKLPDDFLSSMSQEDKWPLHEILFHLYLSSVLSELERGLYMDYSQKDLQDVNLRGSLSLEKQAYELNKLIFHLKVFEYGHLNELNRFYLSVCRKIAKMSNVRGNKMKAMRVISILDENEPMSNNELLSYIKSFNRIDKRFQNSYLLGKVIVEKTSLLIEQGGFNVPTLLINMNRLFEKFFAVFLERNKGALLPEYDVLEQRRKKWYLLKNKKFELIPDIVLTKRDKDPIIMDTKYKPIDQLELANSKVEKRAGIVSTDMYQMFAYAKKINSKRLFLVYPTTCFERKPITFVGQFDDNSEIYILKIFMNFEEDGWEQLLANNLINAKPGLLPE